MCGALCRTRIAMAAVAAVPVEATAGAEANDCAEPCVCGIRAAVNTGDVLVESKDPPSDESEPIEKRDLRNSPPPAEDAIIAAFQPGVSKLPPWCGRCCPAAIVSGEQSRDKSIAPKPLARSASDTACWCRRCCCCC